MPLPVKDPDKLTVKESLFVEYMLGDCAGCKTKAARMAGYKHPHVMGARVAARPRVSKVLRGRVESAAMDAEEILGRLADFGRADLTALSDCWEYRPIRGDEGQVIGESRFLDWEKVAQKGLGHLIKKVTPSKYGDIVELHDAQTALNTLAKQAGLMDRVQQIRVEHGRREAILRVIEDPETPPERLREIIVELEGQVGLPSPDR